MRKKRTGVFLAVIIVIAAAIGVFELLRPRSLADLAEGRPDAAQVTVSAGTDDGFTTYYTRDAEELSAFFSAMEEAAIGRPHPDGGVTAYSQELYSIALDYDGGYIRIDLTDTGEAYAGGARFALENAGSVGTIIGLFRSWQ